MRAEFVCGWDRLKAGDAPCERLFRRHFWRSEHAFRTVVDGHVAISIDHSVGADRVTTIRLHDGERLHAGRKCDVPRNPVLSSVQRVRHISVMHGPSNLRTGKLYGGLARGLPGSAFPRFAPVGRVEKLSASEQRPMIFIGEKNRAFPRVFTGKSHPGLPSGAAVLSPGYKETGVPSPRVADCPALAFIQEMQFRELAGQIARQSSGFRLHSARIDGLPVSTAILCPQNAAVSHKSNLLRNEAIVTAMLRHRPGTLPIVAVRTHQFMIADSGALHSPAKRRRKELEKVVCAIAGLRIAYLNVPMCAAVPGVG